MTSIFYPLYISVDIRAECGHESGHGEMRMIVRLHTKFSPIDFGNKVITHVNIIADTIERERERDPENRNVGGTR